MNTIVPKNSQHACQSYGPTEAIRMYCHSGQGLTESGQVSFVSDSLVETRMFETGSSCTGPGILDFQKPTKQCVVDLFEDGLRSIYTCGQVDFSVPSTTLVPPTTLVPLTTTTPLANSALSTTRPTFISYTTLTILVTVSFYRIIH